MTGICGLNQGSGDANGEKQTEYIKIKTNGFLG